MPLPESIRDRIELFARNEEQYRDPAYKEAQLRQEFLDPLFAALGWDMANAAGHAEAYKDVIHEDAIRIGREVKAPDYSFRIGGTRKFFVEAKKPAVLIKDDPEPAYQLRRYSWSAKLPLGVLTDFQEFAIYDGRIRPFFRDKASTARIFYCTYDQFPEKWDEIAGIFSKEAVLRGSFDKYAASIRGKRGTATVDVAFLEEIERWRKLLAENLALRNATLSQRDLNFAVQRLIDRIVFLRIAEDRGLEPFGQLQALTAGGNIYPRLCEIFERADYRYNSGLFHFEKDHDCSETPDRLSLRLGLDDASLKDVLKNLYYPDSPYVFSVIPADILGSVYERFLGKVIHLTEGHRARIEEKPEVRKAGGVYYTPTYIVDYIVRQTVGTLVEAKTPKQIEKLRVLDPACGSGSFLIGAYQFLLDWYLSWYTKNDPEKWAKQKTPRVYETSPNQGRDAFGQLRNPDSIRNPQSEVRIPKNWQLTTAERKRILLAHIHGVDIDAQAVEVTKLSLLLKVLEGEARETQGRTREMSAVLPDLGKNIRCGNSLVGHDFYAQPELPALDDEARLKLNTFDWKEGFPEAMQAGGFDAVIGNPPYGADYTESEKQYFQSSYRYKKGKPETYIFFFERALVLSRQGGAIGFITPNAWLTNYYGEQLRRILLLETHIAELADMERVRVFAGAVVDTTIAFLRKGPPGEEKTRVMKGHADHSITQFAEISQSTWTSDEAAIINLMADPEEIVLLTKLESVAATLDSVVDYSQGVIPYKTKADGARNDHISPKRKGGWVPLIESASQIGRYRIDEPRAFIHYGPWLWCAREARYFSAPKVLFHRLRKKLPVQLVGCVDLTGVVNRHSLSNLVLLPEQPDDMLFAVLALFNSRLANWWFVKRYGLLMEVGGFKVGKIPLCPNWERNWPRLASHCRPMLDLHAKLAAAKSPELEDNLHRQIAATDRAIDELVYDLYGLTAAERALVEGIPNEGVTDDAAPPPAPLPTGKSTPQSEADAAHFYFSAKEDPPKKE